MSSEYRGDPPSRQASRSQDQTDDHKSVLIEVTGGKELLDEIEEVKLNISSASNDDIKIQRIPGVMLRNEDFEQYFKPSELSIGPIYAGDTNLSKKELKLKLAAYFFKKCNKKRDGLLEQIKAKIEGIKTCFDKEVIKSYTHDDELICLLFLDGCAMLGFIHCFVNRRLNELSISNGQATLIQQDLFLMENQIPFKVLDVLMGTGSKPIYGWPIESSRKDLFRFLITSNVINFPRDLEDLKRLFMKIGQGREPVHVLDILRDVITADSVRTSNCLSFIKVSLSVLFFPAQILLLSIFNGICSNARNVDEDWSKRQSFRNVQELKLAGIKFKPSHQNLREISFNSRFCITGRLNLPTLVVDNSTSRRLLNLVAYEMCFPCSNSSQSPLTDKDPWITSYVNLLDFLIDNEQDVKDLRASDILRNCLSSDDDVAKMINGIGSYCFAPSRDTYACAKKTIQRHYRRKCAIWMTQMCDAYFSSPWTILALLAATLMLVFTGIQALGD